MGAVVMIITVQKPIREKRGKGFQTGLRGKYGLAVQVDMFKCVGHGRSRACIAKNLHAEHIALAGDLIEIGAVKTQRKTNAFTDIGYPARPRNMSQLRTREPHFSTALDSKTIKLLVL